MKTTTIFLMLFWGIHLNISAQNIAGHWTTHFASYKIFIPENEASINVKPSYEAASIEAERLKSRKSFAKFSDLGEGFMVEEQSFSADMEVFNTPQPVIIGKANKYQTAAFHAQFTKFSRLLEQEPNAALVQ
jgi:exopolysaccharide biosynthesis protein